MKIIVERVNTYTKAVWIAAKTINSIVRLYHGRHILCFSSTISYSPLTDRVTVFAKRAHHYRNPKHDRRKWRPPVYTKRR